MIFPPPFIDIKGMRAALGLTQEEFARCYGLSPLTLRNWEQGTRQPEGPSRILLSLIERNPKGIAREIAAMKGGR